MSIDYNGRPGFSRPRKLYEIESIEQFQDKVLENAFGQRDERAEEVDKLFTDLAKSYLKGKVLKEGLSKMDPAQFIPIEEFADSTRAAATRISSEISENGKVITYSLFQKAVDNILERKWILRGTVLNLRIPASREQKTRETSIGVAGGGSGNLIDEFIAQNGIVTTIIGMLTISPVQSLIFQSLSVEEGAKEIQKAQWYAGIALFLEIGIKAERIIKIMKDMNIDSPLVEEQVAVLSNSESARASALATTGLNYDDFRKAQLFQDSENIINYVTDYYQRYGGLDRPKGHLSIDHWIAYMQVAQNQQTIRGALNIAEEYSPKFQGIREQTTSDVNQQATLVDPNRKKHSKIFVQLASATRSLKEKSNDLYDSILSAMVYQLTDKDMCCLVQIFGAIGNPETLYTVASLLRILATNLSAELLRLQNMVSRFLANLMQDALFELISKINKYYDKLVHKITKAFTVDFKNLTACNGMFTLGWALMHSIQTLFSQLQALMKELSSIIGDFGVAKEGTWEISADRRHLLGIARILEVLAARLDLANTCELAKNQRRPNSEFDDSNRNFDQAIFSILGSMPPNLVISEEDKSKYFPDVRPITSKNLKFTYGIIPEQNNETSFGNCYTPDQAEKIEDLIKNITTALQDNSND